MVKILITGDDDQDRTNFAAILKADPEMDVHEAADGPEAIDHIFSRSRPLLCIFGAQTPEINGVDLVNRIRRDPVLRDQKIALTATATPEILKVLSSLRIEGVLIKPYEPNQTLEKVKAMVANLLAAKDPSATNTAARPVLVVDDEPMERLAVGEIIKSFPGWSVVEASGGQEALDLLLKDGLKPALCLVDVQMPGMNGYQFLEKIRSTPSLQRLRVVILSSLHERDKILPLLKLGIAGYLLKPTKADKVQEVLTSAIL